jgi:hypothetical protein
VAAPQRAGGTVTSQQSELNPDDPRNFSLFEHSQDDMIIHQLHIVGRQDSAGSQVSPITGSKKAYSKNLFGGSKSRGPSQAQEISPVERVSDQMLINQSSIDNIPGTFDDPRMSDDR